MAVVGDPSGAVIGLWQPGSHRGAQLINEPGAWSWSGLNTRDPERSTAFYSAVFGWETETFDADGQEMVMWRVPGYLGGQPEQPVARDVVAGMATMTADRFPDDARPHWAVDFWVDDVAATAHRAPRLGGRVISGPFDTSVGTTAVLADPWEAAFTVSKVAATA
jgi:predicted enzyme related to lactoylglutathione lyase